MKFRTKSDKIEFQTLLQDSAWAGTSVDAKRVVRAMLTLDPSQRPHAVDVVFDPFLSAHATKTSHQNSDEPSPSPRSFEERRAFLGTATSAFMSVVTATYRPSLTLESTTSLAVAKITPRAKANYSKQYRARNRTMDCKQIECTGA